MVADAPGHGTLTISGANATYTPARDYTGPDTFSFRASDGRVAGAPAVVSLTVSPLNDAPTAAEDFIPIAPGGGGAVAPMANDSDVEGQPFALTAFTQPLRGSVVREGDAFRYTSASSFTGIDRFTYTVTDSAGASSIGTVLIASGIAKLDGEWQTYGNSAAHTGYFPGFVGSAQPTVRWSLPAGSTNGNPVTIGGGRVYTTDIGPNNILLVNALRPETGAPIWSTDFPAGSLNPATYFDGRLYLQRGNHGSDTQLISLGAEDGKLNWASPFSAQWGGYFAPAVTSDGIWINGGYYGGMYGFRHDGSQIAFVGLAQYDQWTPSILDGKVYSYAAGRFAQYDADGSFQWEHTRAWNWNGYSMNRVSALAEGRGFMVGNPDLYAVNLADGSTAWTFNGSFTGSPAVAQGTVFAISGSTVRSFRAADGAPLRTYQAGAGLAGQPIVTDDAILVASGAATYIFRRGDGALLHTLNKGGQISLADNRLYVAAADGAVYAYGFDGIPAPAVQSVTVGDAGPQLSMVRSVAVTFNRPVTIAPGAATLVRRGGGGTFGLTLKQSDGITFTYDVAGTTMVGGSLPDGVYDLTIAASAVRAGSATGPAMAADYRFAFHRLFADADGDGDVDNADRFDLRSTTNKRVTSPAYKWYFDHDADGDVDNADLFEVRGRARVTFKGY